MDYDVNITQKEFMAFEDEINRYRLIVYFSSVIKNKQNPRFLDYFRFHKSWYREKLTFGIVFISFVSLSLLFVYADNPLTIISLLGPLTSIVMGLCLFIGAVFGIISIFYLYGYVAYFIIEWRNFSKNKKKYQKMVRCDHTFTDLNQCSKCNKVNNSRFAIRKLDYLNKIENLYLDVKHFCESRYGSKNSMNTFISLINSDHEMSSNFRYDIVSFLMMNKKLTYDINNNLDISLFRKVKSYF